MSEEITQDTEENIRNNSESASFNDITDRIMKDLEDAKDDISQKVDYAKSLIAATLKFYKYKSRSSSAVPENDTEDNNRLIKNGSNLNAKAEDIDEETLIENEEYNIIKKDPSFSRLVDRVETELLKINDTTKSLAESTKLAIRNYLETNKPKSEDNGINIITQPTNSFNSLQNFNEKTKALLEKTELNLREGNRVPTRKRKRTDEVSQPEKFKGCLLDCETKFKSDFKTKTADMDRIVKDVKKKVDKFRSVLG